MSEVATDEGAATTILRLGATDVDAFRYLRLEALRESPEAFGATLEEAPDIEEFRGWLEAPHAVFGVAHGASLRGMAGFTRYGGRNMRHKGVLWGVWVAPVLRRTGAGRSLVEAVIAHARSEVEGLLASVVTGNAAARTLYRRLGFIPYGLERRALRVAGRDLDTEMLELDLR